MKKILYTSISISISLLLLTILIESFSIKKIEEPIITTDNGFVLLELFTSQGCSSCPSADKVLEKYAIANNTNVIALSFHVDYWNYLGWKDPFSKAIYSQRQRDYSSKLNATTYTPQLVINGKIELVGSKKNDVEQYVKEEIKTHKNDYININYSKIIGNKININYTVSNSKNGEITNIALVHKKQTTAISRGENSGLTQTNYNIVTDFKSLNTDSKAQEIQFDFNEKLAKSDYFIVVYTQKSVGGEILSVTKSEIN